MSRILSMGSVNLDHTYELAHIVRAGETTTCTGYATHWGGKGLNQALALARAGAQAHLAARVSVTDLGALQMLCSEDGLNVDVVTGCDAPTGHAIIQVEKSGQNSIVICGGTNLSWTTASIDAVLTQFVAGDILLLQNEINEIPYIMGRAKALGLTIALNPSPISPEMAQWPMEQVDILILNEVEAEALSGGTTAEEMIATLSAHYPETQILLTLGQNGSCYFFQGKYHQQPVVKVKAVDTTAAGDTFTGYFLTAYGEHPDDIPTALCRAAHAAAMAVSKKGATGSIPRRVAVDAWMATK